MQKSCPPVECNDMIDKGAGLVVYLKSDTCTHRLRRKVEIKAPSIPIQLTEKEIELRDGSITNPIKLTALQKSNAQSAQKLLIQTSDGAIAAWDVSSVFCRKKLIIENGMVQIASDFSSDMFDGAMCTADANSIDGMIGYRDITISCPGETEKTGTQFVKLITCTPEEVPDPPTSNHLIEPSPTLLTDRRGLVGDWAYDEYTNFMYRKVSVSPHRWVKWEVVNS